MKPISTNSDIVFHEIHTKKMYSFVCFAVLAVVAQANAFAIGCDDDSQTLRFASAPTFVASAPSFVATAVQEVQTSQPNLPAFDLSGVSCGAQSTERVDRNTYQVSLDNTGPTTVNCPPVVRSQKQAPAVQRPTITLPARIPGPRTVSNQCKCIKTIVKPQVYEQVITVPILQRYIQTTHRPVVEKIHYQAVPVNSQDKIECSQGSSNVQAQLVAVEAPRYEVEAQRVEVETPRFEVPCFEEAQSCEQVAIPVQSVSGSCF